MMGLWASVYSCVIKRGGGHYDGKKHLMSKLQCSENITCHVEHHLKQDVYNEYSI